jgi:hypothetical protein
VVVGLVIAFVIGVVGWVLVQDHRGDVPTLPSDAPPPKLMPASEEPIAASSSRLIG